MKNQKGVTLIELIVVVAIMSIVLGIAYTGISSLSGQRMKTAYKRIYSTLGSAQTFAMSKGNTLYGVIADDKNVISVYTLYLKPGETDYSVVSSDTFSNTVQVYFKDSAGNTYSLGDADFISGATQVDGLLISINRNTGAFDKTYTYSGSFSGTITLSDTTKCTPKTDSCTSISVVKNGGDLTLKLVPLTGKFFND